MPRISIMRALLPLACLAVALPSLAATYVVPTDETLIRKAGLIVRGQVLDVAPVEDPDGSIHTEITLEVARSLKGGAPGRTVVIRQPGGAIGDRIDVYPGIGSFAPGEEVIVMLDPIQGSAFRLTDYALGKFHVGYRSDGTSYLRRDGLGDAHVLQTAASPSIAGGAVDPDRDAAAFERFIVETVRGARPEADYVVAPGTAAAEGAEDVHAEFEFLGTPPARWIEFDTGGTVTIRDNSKGDAGSHCPTGCHGEVAGGLNAWNFASGAGISLLYGGTDGTMRRTCLIDLRNQVQFNDPCNEITDLSGCSGALALGGYSAYSTGGGTKCPERGNVDFGHVIAGRILVNNGVGSCLNTCNYRDMIAHETGHILGADHSNVSGALMGPYLANGRCGALQGDDVDFAVCAYAGTPAPCDPPTITRAYARSVDGILRAVVLGTGFSSGDRVEIDSGGGFVAAKRTVLKSSVKILGMNVKSIWPKAVPVQVRVVTPAGCASSAISAVR